MHWFVAPCAKRGFDLGPPLANRIGKLDSLRGSSAALRSLACAAEHGAGHPMLTTWMDGHRISGCSTVDIHQLCPVMVATRMATKTSWQPSWGRTTGTFGRFVDATDANSGAFSELSSPGGLGWSISTTRFGSTWSSEKERCRAICGVWRILSAWGKGRCFSG